MRAASRRPSATGILASRRACSTSVGTETALATSMTSTFWNASMNLAAFAGEV